MIKTIIYSFTICNNLYKKMSYKDLLMPIVFYTIMFKITGDMYFYEMIMRNNKKYKYLRLLYVIINIITLRNLL